jgi:DNA-binding transcriptional MerR regulator
VGERSYLAIGDVLALLREEFPDVTISKIRFLESRGLLDPERTPSGYRKFYEPDVDRLRWILRQQREHFLPLKVIKGRLENGMTDPEAPTPHLFEMGDPPPEAEPVLVGVVGTSELVAERTQSLAALAQVSAVAASLERAPSRRAASVLSSSEPSPSLSVAPQPGATASSSATEAEAVSSPQAEGTAEAETAAVVNSGQSRRRRSSAVAPAERGPEEPAGGPASAGAGGEEPIEHASPEVATEEAESDGPKAGRGLPRSTAGLPGAGLSGASLTLAELASASGLEVEGVEELESFGLIAGRTVAGVRCYDEDAVLVAKLAARFAPYGIEARHLKIFKHAADRQTGLFAQVVTPLLRQRNPQAHARAIEELSELAELGEALMRCFSQAMLRELTGG